MELNVQEIISLIKKEAEKSFYPTLWSGGQCAEYFKVSPRHFVDRISKAWGFPTPIKLPSDTGRKGHSRWYSREVIEWAANQREAA